MGGGYIPYSHFCKYPGPPSLKHTTFPNQGRDIYKSVNKGYRRKNLLISIEFIFICVLWKSSFYAFW